MQGQGLILGVGAMEFNAGYSVAGPTASAPSPISQESINHELQKTSLA
jgi:hypothetical protein